MAHLAVPDLDDEGEFGKTLALATFRSLRASLFGDPGVPCLPVPGAFLTLEEIDALASQCWDWLTRDTGSDVPDALAESDLLE